MDDELMPDLPALPELGYEDWLNHVHTELSDLHDDALAASLAAFGDKDSDEDDLQVLLSGEDRPPLRGGGMMRASYSMNDLVSLQQQPPPVPHHPWNHKLVSVKPRLQSVPEGGPSNGGPLNLMPLPGSTLTAACGSGAHGAAAPADMAALVGGGAAASAPGVQQGQLQGAHLGELGSDLLLAKGMMALGRMDNGSPYMDAQDLAADGNGLAADGAGHLRANNSLYQHQHQHHPTTHSHKAVCAPVPAPGEVGTRDASVPAGAPPSLSLKRPASGLPLRKSQSAVELGSWRGGLSGATLDQHWAHDAEHNPWQLSEERVQCIQRHRDKRLQRGKMQLPGRKPLSAAAAGVDVHTHTHGGTRASRLRLEHLAGPGGEPCSSSLQQQQHEGPTTTCSGSQGAVGHSHEPSSTDMVGGPSASSGDEQTSSSAADGLPALGAGTYQDKLEQQLHAPQRPLLGTLPGDSTPGAALGLQRSASVGYMPQLQERTHHPHYPHHHHAPHAVPYLFPPHALLGMAAYTLQPPGAPPPPLVQDASSSLMLPGAMAGVVVGATEQALPNPDGGLGMVPMGAVAAPGLMDSASSYPPTQLYGSSCSGVQQGSSSAATTTFAAATQQQQQTVVVQHQGVVPPLSPSISMLVPPPHTGIKHAGLGYATQQLVPPPPLLPPGAGVPPPSSSFPQPLHHLHAPAHFGLPALAAPGVVAPLPGMAMLGPSASLAGVPAPHLPGGYLPPLGMAPGQTIFSGANMFDAGSSGVVAPPPAHAAGLGAAAGCVAAAAALVSPESLGFCGGLADTEPGLALPPVRLGGAVGPGPGLAVGVLLPPGSVSASALSPSPPLAQLGGAGLSPTSSNGPSHSVSLSLGDLSVGHSL